MEINLTFRTTKPDEVAKLMKVLAEFSSPVISGASGAPVIDMKTVSNDAVSTKVDNQQQAQDGIKLDMDLLRTKTQTAMTKKVENKSAIKGKLSELKAENLPLLKQIHWTVYNEFLDNLIAAE